MIKIIIKHGSLDNLIETILVNVLDLSIYLYRLKSSFLTCSADKRVFLASHEKECGIITTLKGFFSALKMYTIFIVTSPVGLLGTIVNSKNQII